MSAPEKSIRILTRRNLVKTTIAAAIGATAASGIDISINIKKKKPQEKSQTNSSKLKDSKRCEIFPRELIKTPNPNHYFYLLKNDYPAASAFLTELSLSTKEEINEKFSGASEEHVAVQTLRDGHQRSGEWNAGEGTRTEKDNIWLGGTRSEAAWIFDLLSNCRDSGLYDPSDYYLWTGYVVTKEEQVLDLDYQVGILPAFMRLGAKLKSVEKDGDNSVFSFMVPQADPNGSPYNYEDAKIYIQRLANRNPSDKYTYIDHQRVISISLS